MDNKILDIKNYTSIQDAINHMNHGDRLTLENQVYDETIYINKSIDIVGLVNSVLILSEKKLIIENAEVNLSKLKISIGETDFDANILLKKSQVSFEGCNFDIKKQSKDLYAAIWSEDSSLALKDNKITSDAGLIKHMHGHRLSLINNDLTINMCILALEMHGVKNVELIENKVTCPVNFLRMTKIHNYKIEKNEFTLAKEPRVSKPRFFILDGIESGQESLISGNVFHTEKTLNFLIQNSYEAGRVLFFNDNTINSGDDLISAIKFDKIKGTVNFGGNKMSDGKIIANQCGEVSVNASSFRRFSAIRSKHLRLSSNEDVKQILVEGAYHLYLKANKIDNKVMNEEAVRLSTIDKIRLEGNTIKSVDHGVSVLNDGNNLETLFINNDFRHCKKRAINMTAVMQINKLKAELVVKNNIFIDNDKALFMDDQNIKHVTVEENYFDNNKLAVILNGGKSTGDLKVTGNFFTPSNQLIEIRSAKLCHITHNNLNNSKLHIRGCEDILIHGNLYDNPRSKRGKCLDNEVCIKLGGHLTVSHNKLLRGRLKNEDREVFDTLNISSYERRPAVTIHDNTQLDGFEKRSFFDNYQPKSLQLYPDASILSMLQYEGDLEHNLNLMDMDEVMKRDFLDHRSTFIDLKDLVESQVIRKKIHTIVEKLQIEILSGRDSNDIYRFIVKTNETVEMLKIYVTMEETVDSMTEKRIVSVLDNYMQVLSGFMMDVSEEDQDKLKAQINLLENLL
ncbi:hypothetical protein EZV73_03315 [Acidaminobacter sp. JC074]|uniref:right-handed parallel beta-helix repeat-containing protein n=1 Tax=Acidaminobacter sp. JC074 TaxID=2530199 RepID=UPI001F103720|nr:right-handed parallel beta-helix repeat-containing protein [Acidaminobacter sp. JC074]MCH4886579.1 hypothetical protein [Acidaminobacter sp. JC074]